MTTDPYQRTTLFERLAFGWTRVAWFMSFSLAFAVISLGVVTFPANVTALIAAWRGVEAQERWIVVVAEYKTVFKAAFVPGLIVVWPLALVIVLTLIGLQVVHILPGPLRVGYLIGVLALDYLVSGFALVGLAQLSVTQSLANAWQHTIQQVRSRRGMTGLYLVLMGGAVVLSLLWPMFGLLGLGGTLVVGAHHLLVNDANI
ncbi:hypothetical protein [Sulfobacillus harzensis]|uniref:DUF624 domain-containing protein n=1 Tax=Sulfobacillus harzensis TaxID=2729629 RepID=A0A7Y0L705_9FIRM|nr:hypothetical protein [Sulfobacillus harzensis]NMP23906.1 hypothetical protein [Sulfobacillus harzensis]